MKEELVGIERYRATKERLLTQASSNLEAMQTTLSGLESELHQVKTFYILSFWNIYSTRNDFN